VDRPLINPYWLLLKNPLLTK